VSDHWEQARVQDYRWLRISLVASAAAALAAGFLALPPVPNSSAPAPAVVILAQDTLAQQLTPEDRAGLRLVRWEPVTWSDTCLEWAPRNPRHLDRHCSAQQIAGYRVVFAVGADFVEIHTNADGARMVRAWPEPWPPLADRTPVERMRYMASFDAGVGDDSLLDLVSYEEVVWDEGCMGVWYGAHTYCGDSPSVTPIPGLRAVFRYGGHVFEIRADRQGERAVSQRPRPIVLVDAVLVWDWLDVRGRPGEGPECGRFEIAADGYAADGHCGGALAGAWLRPDARAAFALFQSTYASFEVQTTDSGRLVSRHRERDAQRHSTARPGGMGPVQSGCCSMAAMARRGWAGLCGSARRRTPPASAATSCASNCPASSTRRRTWPGPG
jgi:hypothetical protein